MHPTFAIIVFTTISGAGYGLLALCGVLAAFGALPDERSFALTTAGLSFGLIVVGLCASTLHLGHPERAWRAFTQWRSSWLSREGVAAIVTFAPALAFWAAWASAGSGAPLTRLLGLLSCVMSLVTVGCTAMIYASLKPVHQWRSKWVLPNYLALSLMIGGLWLNALMRLWGYAPVLAPVLACALVLLALLLKEAYWAAIREAPAESTVRTATGLRPAESVKLFEAPHTEQNYLLREMGFQIGRKHAVKLRMISRIAAFLLPLGLTLASLAAAAAPAAISAVAAVASGSLGLLVERWLFFAEAKHTVTLYYGAQRV
jgi:DMSO reductase anchor subunit